MGAVLAGASGGLAQVEPVGSAVAGPPETRSVDEGFDQLQGPGICALPVLAQPAQDQAQDLAGQLRRLYPG